MFIPVISYRPFVLLSHRNIVLIPEVSFDSPKLRPRYVRSSELGLVNELKGHGDIRIEILSYFSMFECLNNTHNFSIVDICKMSRTRRSLWVTYNR